MSWDDIKKPNDDFLSSDWNAMVADQKSRLKVITGEGIPTSAPEHIGYIYIDLIDLRIYIATGTSSSSDWKKVLSQ